MSSNKAKVLSARKSNTEIGRKGYAEKSNTKKEKKVKRRENSEIGSKTDVRNGTKSVGCKRDDENGKRTNGGKNTDEKKEQTETSRLLKRGQVPCTWRTADLNKNIKEMEAKINNQKNYIKLQEETIKRNDELRQNIEGMKQESDTVFNQYKEEIGKLGAETGGYDTEIRFYNTMVHNSDVSNKMAEEAYSDNVKFSKSLQKTLSILQVKTAKLHDNQDVMEVKKAINSLHQERDREEYLIEKLMWYQDKVQQCTRQTNGSDIENEAGSTKLPGNKDDSMEALDRGDFSGNNKWILPSIDTTNDLSTVSSTKITRKPPLPPGANKYQEKYPTIKNGRCRLPTIKAPCKPNEGVPVQPPVPHFDLTSLLESHKEHKEKAHAPCGEISSLLKSRKAPKEKAPREKDKVPRLDLTLLENRKEPKEKETGKTTKLPSIDTNQKVTESKHVPSPPKSPPKTPRIVRKIRSFFGWK